MGAVPIPKTAVASLWVLSLSVSAWAAHPPVDLDCIRKGRWPEFPPITGAQEFAVRSNFVYVGTLTGLAIFDCRDPSQPRQIGWYATPGSVRDVTITGDLALLGEYYLGIEVV